MYIMLEKQRMDSLDIGETAEDKGEENIWWKGCPHSHTESKVVVVKVDMEQTKYDEIWIKS